MTARTLKLEDVCACVWERSTKQFRGGCCALVSLDQNLALLDWYEMSESERAKLKPTIAEIVEGNASRQRVEWCQKARAAA